MAGPVMMMYATEEQKERYLTSSGYWRRNLVSAYLVNLQQDQMLQDKN